MTSSDLGPGYDYGLGRRQPTAFHYRLARFRDALNDECSFYAMLTWLRRWAALTGDQRAAFHALQFKGQCLRIMGERLSSHRSINRAVDEGTMYGALDLSNGEVGTSTSDPFPIVSESRNACSQTADKSW